MMELWGVTESSERLLTAPKARLNKVLFKQVNPSFSWTPLTQLLSHSYSHTAKKNSLLYISSLTYYAMYSIVFIFL